MIKPMYQIRIIANACITRHNNGEQDIDQVVDSYNMTQDNRDLVMAEIITKMPDINVVPSNAN